jgi:putative endonuclease
MEKKKMNKREIGDKYESMAVGYLMKDGYKILARNYRYSNRGEIDIVAEKKDMIYFFEVKYRKDLSAGHPSEAVGYVKEQKLEGAIQDYLSKHYEYEPEWILQTISIYGKEPACPAGRLTIDVT